jgi:hypothetical protein
MPTRDPAEEHAERGAEAGAGRAFRAQLRLLGIDTDDQDSVNALRDDLRYLRTMRLESEARRLEAFKTIRATAIGIFVTAARAWPRASSRSDTPDMAVLARVLAYVDMRCVVLRGSGFLAGCLLTYIVLVEAAGAPVTIVSIHEIDGIAVRGGRIELMFDRRQSRSCPAIVDRQLWRWQEVEGRRVQHIVPLPSISAPITQPGATHVLLSIEVPGSIAPGDWFYVSRTTYDCPWMVWFGSGTQTRSPDVPVTITEAALL